MNTFSLQIVVQGNSTFIQDYATEPRHSTRSQIICSDIFDELTNY